MRSIAFRRRLIAVLLLCTGFVGAVMRWLTDPHSAAHTMGTMLMVMWVPAVGNMIGFVLNKWRASRFVPPAFGVDAPFVPHARVELTLDTALAGARDAHLHLVLLVGTEMFSARCLLRDNTALAAGVPVTLDLQFLAPAAAMPRLARHIVFRVLQGTSVVGQGQVLDLLGAKA
jgi:hypothetical protein